MSEKSRTRHDHVVLAWSIARSTLVGLGVLVLYWVMPTDSFSNVLTLIIMITVSLAVWVFFVIHEVLRLRTTPYPLIRLSGTLIATIMLLVVIFAQIYLTMDLELLEEFSQPLNKMAALYFSMTVTATVGFGDIVATTEVARAVVTFQMFVNVVLLAAALRGLITVAQSHAKPGFMTKVEEPPEASG